MLLHVTLMDPTPEDPQADVIVARLRMPMPPRVGEYLWLRPLGATNEDAYEYRVTQVVYGHNGLPAHATAEPEYAQVYVELADADADRLGVEPAHGLGEG